METYAREGMARARRIANRGPVRFDERGNIHRDIVDSYWKHGFYVFENVLQDAEIEDLRDDVSDLLARAPVGPGEFVDANGNPAAGIEMERSPYFFVKPLSDPVGGTSASHGRHQSKMAEAAPAEDAPEYVVQIIAGMCQLIESGLRLYGHPHLLAIAEAINGPDFVPYNDAIFTKQQHPGHRDMTNADVDALFEQGGAGQRARSQRRTDTWVDGRHYSVLLTSRESIDTPLGYS